MSKRPNIQALRDEARELGVYGADWFGISQLIAAIAARKNPNH